MSIIEFWLGSIGPHRYDSEAAIQPDPTHPDRPLDLRPQRALTTSGPIRIGAPVEDDDAAQWGEVNTRISNLEDQIEETAVGALTRIRRASERNLALTIAFDRANFARGMRVR